MMSKMYCFNQMYETPSLSVEWRVPIVAAVSHHYSARLPRFSRSIQGLSDTSPKPRSCKAVVLPKFHYTLYINHII